jgi:hypothetical protein
VDITGQVRRYVPASHKTGITGSAG